MPPHGTAGQHGARISIGNTVRIRTGTCVKTCRKAFTGPVDLVYGDIFGKEGIHSPQPPTARTRKLSVRYGNANVLGHRMHAGIGTPRARQIDWAAQQRLNGTAQLARNRRLARLLGKSAIRRAIIGHAKYKGGVELGVELKSDGAVMGAPNKLATVLRQKKRGTRTYPSNIAYADRKSTQRSPQQEPPRQPQPSWEQRPSWGPEQPSWP